METVTKQDQDPDQEVAPIPDDLPASDSDKEELRSALNRMMEAAGSWKRERAQLAAACDRLRRQLNDSGESVAASERGRSQLISECDQLRQRISGTEEAAATWDNERAHLRLSSCSPKRLWASMAQPCAGVHGRPMSAITRRDGPVRSAALIVPVVTPTIAG